MLGPVARNQVAPAAVGHPNAVVDGSPRRKFIDAIKAYGEKYRDAVRNGFKNRLDSGMSGLKFVFEQ